MDVTFADTAAALRDIATWERHRIEFMRDAALRGQVQPPPDVAFGNWAARLVRIEAAVKFLTVLAPNEAEVRERYPELSAPLDIASAPTMWRAG
jgi:hypothetical protein